MMPAKVSTKRPSFVLSVTAESNDSSPVPSSPPSTGNFCDCCKCDWIYIFNAIRFLFVSFVGGESFEGFGENDTADQVSGGGIDLVLAPHINSTPNNQWVSLKPFQNPMNFDHFWSWLSYNFFYVCRSEEYSNGTMSRHTWSRTSLRRTPTR